MSQHFCFSVNTMLPPGAMLVEKLCMIVLPFAKFPKKAVFNVNTNS